MFKKSLLLIVLFCLSLPQLSFAGAWTLPKNNISIEYTTKATWSKEDFGPESDRRRYQRDARAWGWSMNPNIEYGVTDWLTALWGIEYKEAKYKEYARPIGWGTYSVKNHGVTNTTVGGRIRFLKDPVALSGQIKAYLYTFYDNNRQPGIGDGDDSLELRALVGKYFDLTLPFYYGLEGGYRFRNRSVCNGVPLLAEFGFWPMECLLIKTEIDSYWSHEGTGAVEKSFSTWRIGPVIHLLEIYKALTGKSENEGTGVESDYITKKGYSLNLETQYGYVFWGKNSSADQEVILKVSSQF